MRRAYRPPAPAPPRLASSFRWNDRDCGAPNHFLCEKALTEGKWLSGDVYVLGMNVYGFRVCFRVGNLLCLLGAYGNYVCP